MTLPIALTPAAQADFDTDHDWYENRKSGSGRAFRDAVEKTLDRIAANPLLHARVYGEVRRASDVDPQHPPVSVRLLEPAGDLLGVGLHAGVP